MSGKRARRWTPWTAGRAQISFLLNPCDVEQVMKIATSGEVDAAKSTDFYPKLMSGITMYRVD